MVLSPAESIGSSIFLKFNLLNPQIQPPQQKSLIIAPSSLIIGLYKYFGVLN